MRTDIVIYKKLFKKPIIMGLLKNKFKRGLHKIKNY